LVKVVRIGSQHIPPSANAAYANNRGAGKGRTKTAEYRTWATAFGYDVNAAMRGQEPIKGPYCIEITIDRSKRHRLSDIMNREKVVSDTLQAHGVIENDNLCESGTVKWGEAQGGITIEIWPYFRPL
jgi:Holliday junction resolvase RusA-like endonuclease